MLILDSVKNTSMKNESTGVLYKKESTIWDMKIKSLRIKYYLI